MPPRTKARVTKGLGQNPQVESHLTERGFTWNFHAGVPLDEFDEEKSLRNQARVGKPIDPDTINRYVAALDNGDVFPGIVAAELSASSRLLIADGNHRFQAHKQAERDTIDAYIIMGAQPSAVTMLTFEANTKHGLPTGEKDRIHQALYLMDNGVTAEESARRLGLKVSALRTANQMHQANRRAEDMNISLVRFDKLLQGVKARLNQISTDEGFVAMVKLTLDAGLRTDEIAKAVNDLNSLRSSKKQAEYVDALRQTYAESLQTGGADINRRGTGRQMRSGRVAFSMTLGQITALPSPTTIVERLTVEERPDWIRRTQEGMQRLQAVLDELQK